MKFTCEKYLLENAVNIAIRAASAKNPLPLLECLEIEATDVIKITGYDLKKGIYTSFPADIVKEGSILLNAKLFAEIVHSLPEGIVTVNTDENYKANINSADADFNIIGSDVQDYPELPVVNKQTAVSLPENILKKMISQTIFAVSKVESRPVYTGALFELEGNNLTVVAVDGYRMAVRTEQVDAQKVSDCSFIVPGSDLADLEKLCSDSDNDVDISIGTNMISFSVGDTVMISRRLEGEFMNYKKSIPQQFKYELKVEKNSFTGVVNRVSLMIDEKAKTPLRIVFGDNAAKLTCATGIGKAEDRCSIEGNGENLEIGFNHNYLLDALKAAPSNNLKLCLNTEATPCVIKDGNGSENFCYMVLPVRLKAGV